MAKASVGWRIWVDTGGTFTDAVGVLLTESRGATRRAKVLSTGALRAVAVGRAGERGLVIRHEWGGVDADGVRWVPARDLVRGFGVSRLGGAEVARAVGFDAERSVVELDREVALGAGTPIEFGGDEPAPLLAARLLTGTAAGATLPVSEMRLATTRGTNALLTRTGARVALFVTAGFGDLLEIGTQQRPELFAMEIAKPRMLYEAVVEVRERVAADGEVLVPLDTAGLEARGCELVASGVRAAAVAFLHADRFPRREQEAAEVLRGAGFTTVSCSHEVAPFIKVVPRAQTAVVDAYLAPVIDEYVDRLRQGLGQGRLHVLTSAGGLVHAAGFRAKDSLLSGPAGGVVGARLAARRSGVVRAISFDMGGTSTDVARLEVRSGDGAAGMDYVHEHTVGDATLVAPAVAVETVAAGGGSVCGFDGMRPTVGPQSAGAAPGPACYGAGGPLTLTDVNLLLGRLDPGRMPIPIDEGGAQRAFEEVRGRMALADRPMEDGEAMLAGFLDIAAERMAGAIRRVSTRAGYDPRECTLVAFGGAGGQHACAVAERLGMSSILVPAETGVLSAIGLGAAVIERDAKEQLLRPLREAEMSLDAAVARLAGDACREVEASGGGAPRARAVAALRLAGQETWLEMEFARAGDLRGLFAQRYAGVYGHAPAAGREIEVVWVRVIASAGGSETGERMAPGGTAAGASADRSRPLRRAYFGGWGDVPAIDRDVLAPGATVEGPALIFERHGALVLEPGWIALVDGAGALRLRRAAGVAPERSAAPEAVRVELFSHRLESIAREMGEALRRTAVSTNVKERLDYSCALLDAEGELIVNAPHVPVHLGSLGLCVRSVRERIEIGPGDVVITNHPALGGSHLPDITTITGIFGSGGRLLGYAASRAHHAEIGGIRPGSMPPMARALAEEGVVIPPMYLVRAGQARYMEVSAVLEDGPHPTRCISDNLDDLLAAAAANQRGVSAVLELAAQMGEDEVARLMGAMKDRAEGAAGRALGRIGDGEFVAEERLDDGSPLRVAIRIRAGGARIEFTGSAGVHAGNLNATPAIVRSAVMYVLRLLVNEDLPLNEGLMRAVEVAIPRGILNPEFDADPRRAPAVVGGNVETSQRLVDTLLKALGVCACSQGTMNNVVFGGAGTPRSGVAPGAISYYETVCGGAGAGPGFAGAGAVHTHMTNTRITDPEILETRYPVRLDRFAVRRGSGGAGRWRGGDGVVRELVFLAPLSLSILSQHRAEGPYGVAGGRPGARGAQRLARADGEVIELAAIDGREVGRGDRLILETPGGGGYGEPA